MRMFGYAGYVVLVSSILLSSVVFAQSPRGGGEDVRRLRLNHQREITEVNVHTDSISITVPFQQKVRRGTKGSELELIGVPSALEILGLSFTSVNEEDQCETEEVMMSMDSEVTTIERNSIDVDGENKPGCLGGCRSNTYYTSGTAPSDLNGKTYDYTPGDDQSKAAAITEMLSDLGIDDPSELCKGESSCPNNTQCLSTAFYSADGTDDLELQHDGNAGTYTMTIKAGGEYDINSKSSKDRTNGSCKCLTQP